MKYEFYIYTKNGEDCWHWNLKDYKKVIKDINDNKNDESFSVDIQRWHGEGDFDYIWVYPNNETYELPKHVKKYTDKVLEGIRNEK